MDAVSKEFKNEYTSAGINASAESDYGGETGAFYPAPACFPPAGAFRREYTVYFGGSYRENWSEDYVLTISYADRRGVQAAFENGEWKAVGGDRELNELLNSPDCPRLTRQYFQAAASALAAAMECEDSGMDMDRLDECVFKTLNPLAAPELMRILMDDYCLEMYAAYDTVARCCDLSLKGVDQGELYKLQPRTANVLTLVENCRENTMSLLHDARYSQYRAPFGAVAEGSSLHLAFQVMGGKPISAVLNLYGDDFKAKYPMEHSGNMFSVGFEVPEKPGAMWYNFKITDADGSRWLCPDESGYLGQVFKSEHGSFRLTVYKKDFETPDWAKNSVMYQIFPDRFALSDDDTAKKGIEYHMNLCQTPELHVSTLEPPRYLPRAFEENYSPDDFYGGTLKGIAEKLPYIKSLGVNLIYLNPICEARSNHRYDTSDYKKVDPILGTNEDFEELCYKAEKLGIRIILDGVFSHTGADSIYFNRYGSYPTVGACQGQNSEFYPWYDFSSFPEEYRCWWGFKDLPEVEEHNPDWQNYVIKNQDSVVKTWINRGSSGWRLDVADELPDDALSLIRTAAKEADPEAFVLGEVWEDAVLKESYGGRRNYALGYSLDSVMNYPFRTAVLDFIHKKTDAFALRDFLISQHMNYPLPIYYCLMNLLGSHDVVRLRTTIAADANYKGMSREEQLKIQFSDEVLKKAVELEKLCAAVQYAIPGIPSLYYGDEQGMCGVCDPFNRGFFREEDCGLYEWYSSLAKFRNENPAMSLGQVQFMAPSEDILLVLRCNNMGKDAFGKAAAQNACLCVINRGEERVDFEADCSVAGIGLYRGSIAACCANYIKLK